jgi:hypothetical protein
MDYPLKEFVCAVCGRVFVPAVEHIYNERRKGKLYHICGYTCRCAFNKKHPKEPRRFMR